MRLGVAYSTCDRTELTVQSILPLIQPDKFDLWWIDGSKTKAGRDLPTMRDYDSVYKVVGNVGGGSAAAVVYGLSALLEANQQYTHIALCENDVLLPTNWFESTMTLFGVGQTDELEVGAVTARTYEDRILIQRDNYAILHNAGFGMQVYTRKAAEIVLQTLRSHFSFENRKVFALLTGKDIGAYWAFKGADISLMADWGVDRILAQHGLASLGVTPSEVEMIGQVPPLAEQGLRIATRPQELLRDDDAFAMYRDRTRAIREGKLDLHACGAWFQDPASAQWHIYPHQIERIGGQYGGPWRLQSNLGFGTFSWVASDEGHDGAGYIYDPPTMEVPILGACDLLVSGGATGGQVQVEDEASGFNCSPKLPPQGDGVLMQINIPGHMSYRTIRLTARSPGVIFYGVLCRERQLSLPHVRFSYDTLPKP